MRFARLPMRTGSRRVRDDFELRPVLDRPAVRVGSVPKHLLHAEDLSRARIQMRASLGWLRWDAELRDLYRSENLRRRRNAGPVRMHTQDVRPARVPVRPASRWLRRSPQLWDVPDRQGLCHRQVRRHQHLSDGQPQFTLVLASFLASSRALAASSSRRRMPAATKCENNGCALIGRLLNSGWNWQPMKCG